MAWRSSGTSNEDLIQQLWRNGLITNDKVRDAFLQVDRAHYAPRAPYQDSPQPIGHAATISAPHMHASAVEHLLPCLLSAAVPQRGNNKKRILDIGSGSGYLTHVFAVLAKGGGGGCSEQEEGELVVVGVEHIPQLRDLAEANMRKSEEGRALLESGTVRFRVGDGRKGWVEEGEEGLLWDVIHVGASAVRLHAELVEQLNAPGRMFIPVDDEEGAGRDGGQHIWLVERDENGVVEKKRLFGVRYVPLTDAPV